jgi:hypothetical protein
MACALFTRACHLFAVSGISPVYSVSHLPVCTFLHPTPLFLIFVENKSKSRIPPSDDRAVEALFLPSITVQFRISFCLRKKAEFTDWLIEVI